MLKTLDADGVQGFGYITREAQLSEPIQPARATPPPSRRYSDREWTTVDRWWETSPPKSCPESCLSRPLCSSSPPTALPDRACFPALQDLPLDQLLFLRDLLSSLWIQSPSQPYQPSPDLPLLPAVRCQMFLEGGY